MIIQLLTRWSPAIAVPLFYSYVILGSVFYWLVATIWGVFALSVTLWWLAPFLFGVKPFTASELLGFLLVMPRDYTVATVSTIVTILGFLIAFHFATLNWKQQMSAQLKYLAASEIEHFFAEAGSLVTSAELFAESVLETVDEIEKQPITNDTLFKVRYLVKKSQEFLETRKRLSQLSVEVHRIGGKHYSVLASGWGMIGALKEAVAAFSEITAAMWFHVPVVDPADANLIQSFVSQVNNEEYSRFISCCERNHGYIAGVTGGIGGQLVGQVVGMNLASLTHLLSSRKEFKKALDELHRLRGGSGSK